MTTTEEQYTALKQIVALSAEIDRLRVTINDLIVTNDLGIELVYFPEETAEVNR